MFLPLIGIAMALIGMILWIDATQQGDTEGAAIQAGISAALILSGCIITWCVGG